MNFEKITKFTVSIAEPRCRRRGRRLQSGDEAGDSVSQDNRRALLSHVRVPHLDQYDHSNYTLTLTLYMMNKIRVGSSEFD